MKFTKKKASLLNSLKKLFAELLENKCGQSVCGGDTFVDALQVKRNSF